MGSSKLTAESDDAEADLIRIFRIYLTTKTGKLNRSAHDRRFRRPNLMTLMAEADACRVDPLGIFYQKADDAEANLPRTYRPLKSTDLEVGC